MHSKELALTAARAHQSDETRFVHHCYHSDSKDTIPTRENFCFALALLRSRQVDNILESKGLLERLLSYQRAGNFPIYLHEFPTCYDRYRAAEVLPSLLWIVRGFHHVLGQELKQKMEKAIEDALAHSLEALENHGADSTITLRIGCSLLAAGRYFDDDTKVELGTRLVAGVQALGVQSCWFVSRKLGHLLASLNQVAIWPELWQHCRGVYHKKLAAYCGPHLSETAWQAGPEPNLFYFYMGETGPHNRLHAAGLLASLVHPFDKPEISPPLTEGNLEGEKWEILQRDDWSIATINQHHALSSLESKTFSPFYLVWGGEEAMHSMVVQEGNVEKFRAASKECEMELLVTLGPEAELDHPKDRSELVFFCTREGVQLLVEGKKATVFRLGEKVNVESSLSSSLEFSLVQGEGDFTGHLSLGNRPSQVHSGGEARDWKVTIRSIRRSPNCVLKVKLVLNHA